jgi:hypothetical protein
MLLRPKLRLQYRETEHPQCCQPNYRRVHYGFAHHANGEGVAAFRDPHPTATLDDLRLLLRNNS